MTRLHRPFSSGTPVVDYADSRTFQADTVSDGTGHRLEYRQRIEPQWTWYRRWSLRQPR
jgi:hypothetical protein